MSKLSLLIQVLIIALFMQALPAQQYESYKGKVLTSFKKSFKEMEEDNRLFPSNRTQGRQIKNEIEKYPDLPFDASKIIYQAPKQEYIFTPQTKELSPEPTDDFLGLDDSGGSIPPDVNGAVGPNHLMVTLNTQIRVMHRDGTPISTVSTGAFWHPTPGSGGVFDPKVSYDPYENRWLLVMPSSSDPASSRIMIAVSENEDPTGNWFMYSFDGDPENTHWFDYPNYGFNKKWVVISGNLFGSGGTYVALYVFNKEDLYNNAYDIEYTRIKTFDGFTIVPAKTYDPDEEDIYMVHNAGGNSGGYGYINLWKVTGPVSEPAIVNIGLLGVPEPWNNGSYANGGNFAPQLGSDEKINTVDARMENMIFRHGKLWTTHHVYLPAGNPNRCSVQWWEIDAETATINQWGRVDDSTGEMYYAFASIAVNAREDVMIGYGSFSENQYASCSYAFRYADDPVNTLRESYQYKDGLAPYWKTFGAERNRWGDYTATYVDPTDDLDFWTLQEYAELPNSQDTWGTWWAYINLDSEPVSVFSSNITSVPVGSEVNFTDESKFEPTSWHWTFEGGTPAESYEKSPQNIFYNESGLYDVTLVTSNYLGSNTLTMTDYINANTEILPEVYFDISDTLPCLGQVVVLEDLSIFNANAWEWSFSPDLVSYVNGSSSTSQNPEVTFDYPFAYSVTLTATNNNGASTVTKTAIVEAGGTFLPFTEDFETRTYTSQNWTIINPDDNKTWDIAVLNGFENNNYAAYMNLKSYSIYQARDQLISPRLNFYTHSEVYLSFEFAYAQRIAGMTDSLIVSVSDDCGNSWTRILEMAEDTATARSFATTIATTTEFLASGAEYWCGSDLNPQCVNLDLSAWAGKSNVQIRFESYNGYGNNLFIDNVNIDGTISNTQELVGNENQLSIYPNPATGNIYLKGLTKNEQWSVQVFDLNGKKVEVTANSINGSNRQIDISSLHPGIYMVNVISETQNLTSKLIVK